MDSTNSVSFEGADDDSSYRFSFTNAQSDGVLPNSMTERSTATLRASKDFGDLEC